MRTAVDLRLVRREGTKRWHLLRAGTASQLVAECGISINPVKADRLRTMQPNRIGCYDCLATGLSRRLGERAVQS